MTPADLADHLDREAAYYQALARKYRDLAEAKDRGDYGHSPQTVWLRTALEASIRVNEALARWALAGAAGRTAGGRPVTTIPPPMLTFPLSRGEILVPRTPLITDAYHALLVANQERLARWEAWAIAPPLLAETRSFLEVGGARNWLAGLELPVAIAVRGPARGIWPGR